MIDQEASNACRTALQATYGTLAPGVTYYVLRDGKPFVDASFGAARRSGAADGALSYSADTIVHIASVSKLICGVAVLRLIEDWNEIFPLLRRRPITNSYRYVGPERPEDAGLIASVQRYHRPLTLDTRVYDLMKAYLDHASIARDAAGYPGLGITDMTVRQLLRHVSGMRDGQLKPDKLGLDWSQLIREDDPSGKAFFDLVRFISVLFAEDNAATTEAYSNDGYNVLGALVEFLTGTPFEQWCRKKLFPHKSFNDIARRPVDMARAARYYERQADGSYTAGNHHPDYADFGACGGWYTSASAICLWFDAVMKKRRFGGIGIVSPVRKLEPLGQAVDLHPLNLGHPILKDPRPLFDLGLGFDGGSLDLGYLHGRTKNGGTRVPGRADVPGGHTNCRIVYLEGYGDYSVVAFAQANANLDANPLLEAGLWPLRQWLYDPTPLPDHVVLERPAFNVRGLGRLAVWEDAGAQQTAHDWIEFAVETSALAGVTATRTNLFGTTPYAPGRTANSPAFIHLHGYLRAIEAGTYTLRLSSDDGAMLWLDDILVIDNDRHHGIASATGQCTMTAGGTRALAIDWYNIDSSGALYLEWLRPGATAFEAVPVDNLRQGQLKAPNGPLPLPL